MSTPLVPNGGVEGRCQRPLAGRRPTAADHRQPSALPSEAWARTAAHAAKTGCVRGKRAVRPARPLRAASVILAGPWEPSAAGADGGHETIGR
jgi:hypothetical protein